MEHVLEKEQDLKNPILCRVNAISEMDSSFVEDALLFSSAKKFNEYAFTNILLNQSKVKRSEKIQRTNLFDLMTELGYDTVILMIEQKLLPNIDKNILWSDEKAKEYRLFKFQDEEQWHDVNEKFPSRLMFNKMEKILLDFQDEVNQSYQKDLTDNPFDFKFKNNYFIALH